MSFLNLLFEAFYRAGIYLFAPGPINNHHPIVIAKNDVPRIYHGAAEDGRVIDQTQGVFNRTGDRKTAAENRPAGVGDFF